MVRRGIRMTDLSQYISSAHERCESREDLWLNIFAYSVVLLVGGDMR